MRYLNDIFSYRFHKFKVIVVLSNLSLFLELLLLTLKTINPDVLCILNLWLFHFLQIHWINYSRVISLKFFFSKILNQNTLPNCYFSSSWVQLYCYCYWFFCWMSSATIIKSTDPFITYWSRPHFPNWTGNSFSHIFEYFYWI